MFQKVLIVEDMDSINQGLYNTLVNIGITNIHQAKYCDDALLKIKKAKQDNLPYDLLISDLSFLTDHRTQTVTNGDDLVVAVKNLMPKIKTIIYSVEDRKVRVKNLINNVGVNAYVNKGRNGLTDLKQAITQVFNNQNYLSSNIAKAINQKDVFEINDFDIILLDYLSKGHSQDQISVLLKKENIKPSSLSSLEKRINKLKIYFKATNTIHLIAVTKDLGLI